MPSGLGQAFFSSHHSRGGMSLSRTFQEPNVPSKRGLGKLFQLRTFSFTTLHRDRQVVFFCLSIFLIKSHNLINSLLCSLLILNSLTYSLPTTTTPRHYPPYLHYSTFHTRHHPTRFVVSLSLYVNVQGNKIGLKGGFNLPVSSGK